MIEDFESRSLPLASVPALAPGAAHVWLMRLENLPVMEAGTPLRRTDDLRQRRMGQRFVLRLLLGAYLGLPGRDIVLSRTETGKPMFAAPRPAGELSFNVSHTGDLFAVAITKELAIGVDIEMRERSVRAAALARRWFSRAEAERIDGLPTESARTECLRRWSVREAVIKAQGGTLARHIAAVVPSLDDPCRLERVPQDWPPASSWAPVEITGDRHALGFVATAEPLESVTGFRLTLPGQGIPGMRDNQC